MSFTCLPCHAKYNCSRKEIEEIPFGMSYGRCEDCGKQGPCVDCRGYSLKPEKRKSVTKEPKIRYIVSGRLSPDAQFKPLDVRSQFDYLDLAKARVKEWLKSKADLAKAKPESVIQAHESKWITDCAHCKESLYAGDIAFHTKITAETIAVFCYGCAMYGPDGFFDLLDENSLDKIPEHVPV